MKKPQIFKTYECKHCDFKADRPTGYQLHIQRHHPEHLHFECQICRQRFADLLKLSCHVKKKHRDMTQQEYYDKYLNKDAEKTCKVCGEPSIYKDFVNGYFKTCGKKSCKNKLMIDGNIKFCQEKYGTDYRFQSQHYQQVEKLEIFQEKFGCLNPSQTPAVKQKRTETIFERFGVDNASKAYSVKQKKTATKDRNKTHNTSEVEEALYIHLLTFYPDVERYYIDERYPFECDFYIPSRDIFIELHGASFHGFMPFDMSKEKCQQLYANLNSHIETACTISAKRYYEAMKRTWCIKDVKKREIANKNGLKYITLYGSDFSRSSNSTYTRFSPTHKFTFNFDKVNTLIEALDQLKPKEA